MVTCQVDSAARWAGDRGGGPRWKEFRTQNAISEETLSVSRSVSKVAGPLLTESTARGSEVTPGHVSRWRWREMGLLGLALRGGATVIGLATWGFVALLTRCTPYHPGTRRQVNETSPDLLLAAVRHRRAASFVALFVFLYRRSAVHDRMHRNGYPCRFIPSCTEYAIRAVGKYGLWRGLWMFAGRYRRCTPTYLGDYVDFP